MPFVPRRLSMSAVAMVPVLLRRILAALRLSRRRRSRKPSVTIDRFRRHPSSPPKKDAAAADPGTPARPIRVATFNAAMFSMAPAARAVDKPAESADAAAPPPPKSILKAQRGLQSKSGRLRVSINLPDNEIALETRRRSSTAAGGGGNGNCVGGGGRSVLEVLKEVGADIIALQNVKAEEEKEMRPLSELAAGLGMRYVFAESWAPEYGNAVLSRWPIKRWRAVRIFDDSDFRNVLKVTIDVPGGGGGGGELNLYCTHLDHLDERWRMKQIAAVIRCADGPHILAGGVNALDPTDYSARRWLDIVKYYEKIGKPAPKTEVMKFLKSRKYVDAKHFAGECEAVVVAAKGQDVQGTCKYGTRVDYVLASPGAPYAFVPGSYGVISSKGTSDHHIVKVDLVATPAPAACHSGEAEDSTTAATPLRRHGSADVGRKRVVRIDSNAASSLPKGIWLG